MYGALCPINIMAERGRRQPILCLKELINTSLKLGYFF
jgi:hypothetical protein